MKVQFSKSVPFTPEFNGNKALPEPEQFRVTLTPLPLGELIAFTEVLSANKVEQVDVQADADAGKLKSEDTAKMRSTVDAVAQTLPKYVKIVQGADGFDLTDVVSYAQFSGLANELVQKLCEISSPNKDDQKN
jgi:hypothetical protein